MGHNEAWKDEDMSVKRQNYSADFKLRIAFEAIKGAQTINEIASANSINPQLVKQWKKHLLDNGAAIFADRRAKAHKDDEAVKDQLYQQIGQLKVELDWLKKKTGHLG
jgi:putative transposase